jgi:Uma2 family endonuclease
MGTIAKQPSRRSRQEYRNLVFKLLPDQGHWSEEKYLSLTDHTTRLVEFTDGYLEPLPMPTDKHQCLMEFMFLAFVAYLEPRGGKVHVSGLRLRVRPGKIREPDLVVLLNAKDPRRENRFWTGADLALEVVSKDKPERDLVTKRFDYAEGKVPEYWIVNPLNETILVLKLKGRAYVRHGKFRRGQVATSALLQGFSVNVNAVFDAD